jgi:hypothetical protein
MCFISSNGVRGSHSRFAISSTSLADRRVRCGLRLSHRSRTDATSLQHIYIPCNLLATCSNSIIPHPSSPVGHPRPSCESLSPALLVARCSLFAVRAPPPMCHSSPAAQMLGLMVTTVGMGFVLWHMWCFDRFGCLVFRRRDAFRWGEWGAVRALRAV